MEEWDCVVSAGLHDERGSRRQALLGCCSDASFLFLFSFPFFFFLDVQVHDGIITTNHDQARSKRSTKQRRFPLASLEAYPIVRYPRAADISIVTFITITITVAVTIIIILKSCSRVCSSGRSRVPLSPTQALVLRVRRVVCTDTPPISSTHTCQSTVSKKQGLKDTNQNLRKAKMRLNYDIQTPCANETADRNVRRGCNIPNQ